MFYLDEKTKNRIIEREIEKEKMEFYAIMSERRYIESNNIGTLFAQTSNPITL